ncbi:hypothetical protein XENORESO_014184 [Xenotaenia resolanae]|uniref:Uncharacterized protein n=1 Tax=Xenotaenia resolanae TaxID=208358 RepID=A0ABV0W3Z8_9TELE
MCCTFLTADCFLPPVNLQPTTSPSVCWNLLIFPLSAGGAVRCGAVRGCRIYSQSELNSVDQPEASPHTEQKYRRFPPCTDQLWFPCATLRAVINTPQRRRAFLKRKFGALSMKSTSVKITDFFCL